MKPKLSGDELACLRKLDTDAPVKPELPATMADRLIEHGLAIRLVEGGLQLTAFGREHLQQAAEEDR